MLICQSYQTNTYVIQAHLSKKKKKNAQNKIIDARNCCLQGTKLNVVVGIYYKVIC